jgi:hypothetical protein
MNLTEATLRVAVAKLLLEEIARSDKATRTEGLRLFQAANTELGLKSAQVRLPDGTPVATATLTQSNPRPLIDEDAFLAFVEAERPEQVVRSVDPTYRKAVEKGLKVDGDKVVDLRTGEQVPWATVRPAGQARSFSISFTDDGRDLIKEAWQDDPAALLDLLTGTAAVPRQQTPSVEAPADDDDLDAMLSRRAQQVGGEL